MEINRIQNGNVSFGTQIGPKLMNKFKTHPECLSAEHKNVIEKIKNNGLDDTILEFHHAPAKLHELFGYTYQLILKGGVVDRKNAILHNMSANHTLSEASHFPINFKDYGPHTMEYMMTFFKPRSVLNTKIAEEVRNSEKFVKDFDSKNLRG